MSAQVQRLKVDPTQIVNRNIDHYYAICIREEKDDFIINFLNKQTSSRVLIFCRTKARAIRMGRVLTVAGFSVTIIHGDLNQRDRDKVMRSCRTRYRYQRSFFYYSASTSRFYTLLYSPKRAYRACG